MALTYTWAEAINFAQKMAKGANIGSVDELVADQVSSRVWRAKPWFASIQNIAAGTLPLVDGQQDYSSPTNTMRLLKARLVRTDTTPDENIELDVHSDVDVDLVKASPYAIRIIAHQPSVGGLRLEKAVEVASGTTWEIQGSYQIHPTKITATSQGLWFHDEYFDVAWSGCLYWIYKLADDSRAGSAVTDHTGRTTYNGALGEWMAAIEAMWRDEEVQGNETYFPSTSMGTVRQYDSRGIFGG